MVAFGRRHRRSRPVPPVSGEPAGVDRVWAARRVTALSGPGTGPDSAAHSQPTEQFCPFRAKRAGGVSDVVQEPSSPTVVLSFGASRVFGLQIALVREYKRQAR